MKIIYIGKDTECSVKICNYLSAFHQITWITDKNPTYEVECETVIAHGLWALDCLDEKRADLVIFNGGDHYSLMNKYPMVIRDVEGSTMHMMVNTTCSWHRDGTAMPQGSGSITGIIVHEHCDNFEWDQAKADAHHHKQPRQHKTTQVRMQFTPYQHTCAPPSGRTSSRKPVL